jgi:hypothetical protein
LGKASTGMAARRDLVEAANSAAGAAFGFDEK